MVMDFEEAEKSLGAAQTDDELVAAWNSLTQSGCSPDEFSRLGKLHAKFKERLIPAILRWCIKTCPRQEDRAKLEVTLRDFENSMEKASVSGCLHE